MQPDTNLVPDSQVSQQAVKVGQVFVDPSHSGVMHVFFCTGKDTNYYFKNGQIGEFKVGTVPGFVEPAFVTDVQGYIDELFEQIRAGHPIFFTRAEIATVTKEQLDPHADIKAAAIKEYQEKLAAEAQSEEAKKLLKELGVGVPENSETADRPQLKGIANSLTVNEAMAGSDSSGTMTPANAALAGLLKK